MNHQTSDVGQLNQNAFPAVQIDGEPGQQRPCQTGADRRYHNVERISRRSADQVVDQQGLAETWHAHQHH